MPPRKPPAPSPTSISKGHLIVLGLALAFMFFAFGGLDGLVKLLSKSTSVAGTGQGGAGPGTGLPADMDFRALTNELAMFSDWILSEDGAPSANIRIQQRASVRRDKGASRQPLVREVWVVPVGGTVYSDGGWIAAIGPKLFKPGEKIAPSPTKCGYLVSSVSYKCVWFVAFYGEEPEEELPVIDWFDIEAIRLSSGPRPEPDRIEFRSGKFMRLSQSIAFRTTGAEMVLEKLWRDAVQFRYVSGEGLVLDLLCVVLP